MTFDRRIGVAVLVALAPPATAPAAAQQSGPSVSVQTSYGTRFNDAVYGLNTSDGHMATVVINADGVWRYGENTSFVRLFSGKFIDGQAQRTGQNHQMYMEWTSRLSLAALAGRRNPDATLRDVFVAGQINRGSTGFHADLIGIGFKFTGPFIPLRTTSTLYYRHATGDGPGIKYRTSWALPLRLGFVSTSLEGSIDVVTGGAAGTDVNVMPDWFVDVGALAGGRPGMVHAGVEWFLHTVGDARTSVPQLTARWTF